jgi:hypothetical protein
MEQATLNQIKRLTQINDHGEAYFVAAKALGNDALALKFKAINRRHEQLGSLPVDLYATRRSAYEELMAFAKKAMKPETYQKFYMAF